MPTTYVSLYKWTELGIKTVKDAPRPGQGQHQGQRKDGR